MFHCSMEKCSRAARETCILYNAQKKRNFTLFNSVISFIYYNTSARATVFISNNSALNCQSVGLSKQMYGSTFKE